MFPDVFKGSGAGGRREPAQQMLAPAKSGHGSGTHAESGGWGQGPDGDAAEAAIHLDDKEFGKY